MKQIFQILMIALSLVVAVACNNNGSKTVHKSVDSIEALAQLSEEEAVALRVLNASGGQQSWEDTKYLKWNFFNARRHIWNKHSGDLIIHGLKDSFLIDMNLHSMTGNVTMNGEKLIDQDSISKYIQQAEEMWINDSYWVFLPFKLRDPGVSLELLDPDTTKAGILAERLQMSFDSVGVTPSNKYIIYIDPTTDHIFQWDFYSKFTDSIPRFSTPWEQYSAHGNIMLSASRGGDYIIEEIATGDSLSHYFEAAKAR